MLFNSFEFLIFFPIVTIVYFLLPHKYRWQELLIASTIFYMAFIPVYIFILLITILIDYTAARFIEPATGTRRKYLLLISIISTCLVLFFFKYFNFVAFNIELLSGIIHHPINAPLLNLILPIGLSFHTFQSLSYVIEVYYGRQKAERHFGIYSLYVMFYPQLVAGPIERPQNLLSQIRIPKALDAVNLTSGLRLMLWGFFKKLVVADNLANVVNIIYGHPSNQNGLSLLIATYFFAFQIYCDFSGYSDIAIGAARIMGFRLMTNFNVPYISKSVGEFWSRWHISLSTWFRDYVYIPLGGNRVAVPRLYLNLFITFLISGLWHGANWTFVIWGALNGIYLIGEQIIKRIFKLKFNSGWVDLLRIFITFHLILFSWIFFRAASVEGAFFMINKIVFQTSSDIISFFHGQSAFANFAGLSSIALFKFIGIIIVFYIADRLKEMPTLKKHFHSSVIFRFLIITILFYTIIFFGYFGETQFIYFQF